MFACSYCKMEFVRSVDLHRHVDAAHTIDDQMDGSFSDEKDNIKDVTMYVCMEVETFSLLILFQ